MKKKLAVLLAITMLASCIFTGCGIEKKNTDPQDTSSDPVVSDSTSSDDNSSDDAGDSASVPDNANSEYLSWTSKEYSAASGEEKTEAIIAFTVYTCQLMDMDYITEDLLRSTMEEESVKAQLESSKAQIEASLNALPDMSLKEIADLGASVLQDGSDAE